MRSGIPRRSEKPWVLWVVLLALAQALDVLTTKVDIGHGALEGNAIAAGLLSMNGYAGLLLTKLALVAAMAAAVVLVVRYSEQHPGPRAGMARTVVWRGLQLCVFVLVVTGLHNVLVLAALQGWNTPTILTTLPLNVL